MTNRYSARLLVALFAQLACIAVLAATPDHDAIDASVRRAMETFNAPGVAVSVVYNDEVYYAQGYGVIETGKPKAVDDQTLFHIGSVSKAFTAASRGT